MFPYTFLTDNAFESSEVKLLGCIDNAKSDSAVSIFTMKLVSALYAVSM